jgi:CheY-like chemotaxis protein
MKTILIVEDDEKIATALSLRLRANGYRVLTANDGFTAIELALEQLPDLMVLDIWMPVMDGMEAPFGLGLALEMKDAGVNIPFIIMTASRKPELRQLAAEAGCAAFVEKPYESEVLLKAIENALTPQVAA